MVGGRNRVTDEWYQAMSTTYDLYKKVTALPFGHTLFSIAYGRKAPYFRTIKAQVREVTPHRAAVDPPSRKAVRNHIGTVHAIAVCNGLESAMGLRRRRPPRRTGMAHPDVPVTVHATRDDGTCVVEGTIHLWVTGKTG